jgi:hypothetical protein
MFIKYVIALESKNMKYEEYQVKVFKDTNHTKIIWYQNDKIHRLDGPAAESICGTKSWYQNDKLHRIDGPAVKFANGDKCWYQNGKLHRIDGPAMEYYSGAKYWYINGERLTEQEFNARNNSYEGKIVEIDGKQFKLTLM